MVLIPIRDKSDVSSEHEYLSPYKAVEIQWDLLKKWEPRSEVWTIFYGDKFISGLCAVGGVLINSMFRRKLKLRTNGYLISNFYAMLGGSALGGFFFKLTVTDKLITYKEHCFTCMELKAIMTTNAAGILFPAVSCPVLNLGLAGSTGLRIPYWYEARELSRFWWSVIKPGLPHLSALFIINTLAVSLIAYKQAIEMNAVADVVYKADKYFKQKASETLLN